MHKCPTCGQPAPQGHDDTSGDLAASLRAALAGDDDDDGAGSFDDDDELAAKDSALAGLDSHMSELLAKRLGKGGMVEIDVKDDDDDKDA